MAGKLYPPYINGTLPAFWLNYDASQSVITGASITIPFSENPAVGSAVSGYKLRLRTASTGSYLFEPIYTVQKDAEARKVTFELTPTQAKKLKEGQYYKAQVAYCGESKEDVGYFSTVGVIKCTSKPTISISNLSLDNINFFTNEFIGLYDMSNCKDQTEKVYSYSFQMFDENGDIYYDTGELLHNSSYDTEYGYSIDRVSINEFVAQDVTYSIQYNVTTLNGLELSTGQYRLTNEGFNSLSRDIQILPKSNLDNGYITINFKGELDKDRSFYYVLNEEFLKDEKDLDNNYIIDQIGKIAIDKIMDGVMANNSHILYMKTYDLYRYYKNGLNQPFIYSSQLKDFQNTKKSVTIDNKIYYCNEENYEFCDLLLNNILQTQEYINQTLEVINTNENGINQLQELKNSIQNYIEQLQDYNEETTLLQDYINNNSDDNFESSDNFNNSTTLQDYIIYLDSQIMTIQDRNDYLRNDVINRLNEQMMVINNELNSIPLYSLVATGKDLTKSLTYNYVEEHHYFIDETGKYLMTGFGDSYYLIDKEPYDAFYYGAFLLSRASDEDNYSTWMNIERFRLEEQPPSSHQVKDFTIEHGRKYIYALQQYNIWGLYSSRVISDIYEAGFEDAFLYDGERALKIRFNPEISNFKTTILEQKTDTLGGRFPYITRNGDTYYKEFPIGGLIAAEMDEEELFIKRGMVTSHRHSTSAVETYEPTNALRDYHMFSDENIMLERQFKLEVLNWLNDGQPKLFKSPYEGNYIVRLMNTSLTPVKELGRMLHSFSTTAYEIAECNYDNLVRFGFIKTKEPSDFVGLWKTYNLADQEVTEDGLTIHFDGGLVSFSIQDMVPGDIVEIIYESGLPATEKIMIGITGAYMCAGINRPISGLHIPLRHLVPDIGDKIQQKMTGMINCYYKGARITKFDAITGMQLKTIPSYQFIGVDPALEQMKRTNWSQKNLNSDTFIKALSAEGFANFQGYTIRDYIDKMIEKQEINQETGTLSYFISQEGQQYINAFDPGDLVSRINATINLGESDKIKLIKLEQGHFRLRELVPVYAQSATDDNFKEKEQEDDWLVSVSPYGYPHPIEELMDFEMIDPFCIFEVFQLKDGYWQPAIGRYDSPYYDPYYKNWLYDYEPYFQMNYQAKKISYLGTNEELSQPYKRSDLTLVIDSETGEYQYKNGQVNIPEERIYDIEIQKERIDDKDYYYYIDSTFYDQNHNLKENRIYLNVYNFYESLGSCPKGTATATPVPNAIYYIKKYDNQIDLSIIKEKHFKDFENVNLIRIGNGIIAELTFQIKVIDYYTESGDAEVRAAKNDYLEQAAFYRNIMGAYAVIAKAYQNKKKNTALMNLYERLLRGKNGSILADMSEEDVEIIRQQLGYEQDKKDLKLLTIYQAILLDQTNLGSEISNLLFEYFDTINLKIFFKEQSNLQDVINRLNQILVYATDFYDYAIIDLEADNIIAGQKPNETITLENINQYNYYVSTDWDTRESQYYFARKEDINEYYRLHQTLIKDYIAIDPEGKIIENVNQYSKAMIQLLNKVDYEQLYNEVLIALNDTDFTSYKNQEVCLWIKKFEQTNLHEESEIENILEKNTTSEGAQNKLQIIQSEIEEFNNIIDELSTQSSNVDVEYTQAYNNLIDIVNTYNNISYFEWAVRHLIDVLSSESPSGLSLQQIESTLQDNMSHLISYDALGKTHSQIIFNRIKEIQYQLAQDFEKIKLYDRIIKDKDNDAVLDDYNTKQITISRGKILKCAYEAYFSGQKILQLLLQYSINLSDNAIKLMIENYKNTYIIFYDTFQQCLNSQGKIDQVFIDGLINYYNNLLIDYKNLLAQMKSNWESSQLVDGEQYKQSVLMYNELYFIYFILNTDHDSTYNCTNAAIPKKDLILSPILQTDSSNQLVQKVNTFLSTLPEPNLITSYVNKNYNLNRESLSTFIINKDWIYEKVKSNEEEEVISYIQTINNTKEFQSAVNTAQSSQVHFFYFQNIEQIGGIKKEPIQDISFIYNPLKEAQYRFVFEKLKYNSTTQYYVYDSEMDGYRQVTLNDGFEDNIEYYIQVNQNGYFKPVYNLSSTISFEPRPGESIYFYYYDIETQTYKIKNDENYEYNVPYYACMKVKNKSYFDTLNKKQQNLILNISSKANNMLTNLINWFLEYMSASNVTNRLIITNLRTQSTINKIKKDLAIADVNEIKEKFKSALNDYNLLINTYQQALKKNSAYPSCLANYNADYGTNYSLSDGENDIIYSLTYTETPSNETDPYEYFYSSEWIDNISEEDAYSFKIKDLTPIKNLNPSGEKIPDVPYYDSLIILDSERLAFFSTTEEKVINDIGVVAWYKQLSIDEELQYYKQLLKEAVELHDLYNQQYLDYQKKYEKYYEAATESNEVYNNYRGTPELDYYLNNDSSKFDELRKGVKEAWWKFLNLLDDKYTAEKERGMYL